jgi:hypothetical protein
VRVAGDQSSPKLGLATTSGHGGLPQRHGRQEGGTGTLVAGSPRAEGAVRRASGGGERSLVATLGVRGARGEEVKRGERG